MAEEKILPLVKVTLFNFVIFPHILYVGLNFFPLKICLLVLQIIISTMSASYSEGKAGGLSTGSDQDDSVKSSPFFIKTLFREEVKWHLNDFFIHTLLKPTYNCEVFIQISIDHKQSKLDIANL